MKSRFFACADVQMENEFAFSEDTLTFVLQTNELEYIDMYHCTEKEN